MKIITLIFIFCFCLVALPSLAQEVPYITADSTATLLIDPGPYQGWYLYEIYVEWDLNGHGMGLSHWDVILDGLCDSGEILIEFDTPAGYSTSEEHPDDPGVLSWEGYWEPGGDPTIPGDNPAVKYNSPHFPSDQEPGEEGYGTFFFYTNSPPEYGIFTDAVVAKYGAGETFGDFTGDYPTCVIIPEPSVMTLLPIGLLAFFFKRRAAAPPVR